MKFIVQLFEGKIVHDFTFELIKAQEYFKWMDDPFEIIYVEKDIPLDLENPDEYIPVGSVNFVSDYLNMFLDTDINFSIASNILLGDISSYLNKKRAWNHPSPLQNEYVL